MENYSIKLNQDSNIYFYDDAGKLVFSFTQKGISYNRYAYPNETYEQAARKMKYIIRKTLGQLLVSDDQKTITFNCGGVSVLNINLKNQTMQWLYTDEPEKTFDFWVFDYLKNHTNL